MEIIFFRGKRTIVNNVKIDEQSKRLVCINEINQCTRFNLVQAGSDLDLCFLVEKKVVICFLI